MKSQDELITSSDDELWLRPTLLIQKIIFRISEPFILSQSQTMGNMRQNSGCMIFHSASTLFGQIRRETRSTAVKMGLTLRIKKNSQRIRQCGAIVFTRYLKTVRIALRMIFDRYFRGLTTMFTSVQTPKSVGSSEVY